VFENLDRERAALHRQEAAPAELSDRDLEAVTAGMLKSPGGVGGPASGLGVRPGLGVGAPGLGWNRGPG
jgi:hypothetical protein